MFEILILALIIYGAYRLVRRQPSGPVGPEKCRNCRFNRRSDADGTLCSLGGKEVFKNRIQVSWCQNFENR